MNKITKCIIFIIFILLVYFFILKTYENFDLFVSNHQYCAYDRGDEKISDLKAELIKLELKLDTVFPVNDGYEVPRQRVLNRISKIKEKLKTWENTPSCSSFCGDTQVYVHSDNSCICDTNKNFMYNIKSNSCIHDTINMYNLFINGKIPITDGVIFNTFNVLDFGGRSGLKIHKKGYTIVHDILNYDYNVGINFVVNYNGSTSRLSEENCLINSIGVNTAPAPGALSLNNHTSSDLQFKRGISTTGLTAKPRYLENNKPNIPDQHFSTTGTAIDQLDSLINEINNLISGLRHINNPVFKNHLSLIGNWGALSGIDKQITFENDGGVIGGCVPGLERNITYKYGWGGGKCKDTLKNRDSNPQRPQFDYNSSLIVTDKYDTLNTKADKIYRKLSDIINGKQPLLNFNAKGLMTVEGQDDILITYFLNHNNLTSGMLGSSLNFKFLINGHGGQW